MIGVYRAPENLLKNKSIVDAFKRIKMIMKRKMNTKKRIAIVAQDSFKSELINWAYFNRKQLNRHNLISPGEMGQVLEGTANTYVTKLASARNGGYTQLAKMISNDEVDIIVFFCNPFDAFIAEGELKSLYMIAGKKNIVIATNKVSADFVITSSLMDTDHTISEESISGTKTGKPGYSNN